MKLKTKQRKHHCVCCQYNTEEFGGTHEFGTFEHPKKYDKAQIRDILNKNGL